MNTFGMRLRQLRQEKKLRQRDLAKKLGITESAYGYYEQGRREPSYETLQQLADFFDVSVDWLLGRTDDPTTTKETNYNLGDNPVPTKKPEKLTEEELAEVKAIADGKIKLVINGKPLKPEDDKMAREIFKSIYERAKARLEEDD